MVEPLRAINLQERQNPSTESLIRDIIRSNEETFFGQNHQHFIFTIQEVFYTQLMRELGGDLLDISQRVYKANVVRKRRSDGHSILTTLNFMLTEGVLVPLGTHTAKKETNFKAYKLDDSQKEIVKEIPFFEYVLNQLPETILLTRVLSDDEAAKFACGDNNLGSSNLMFWQDSIHATLHNITNEFSSESYRKAIKLKLSKEDLIQLVKARVASFGTYAFLLKNRDHNSPLPFDIEIVFSKAAIPTLLVAYQTWSIETNQSVIENPFYKAV